MPHPHGRQRRSSRRRRTERGAALVEAAIIMLPLAMIVFGIIEYGFIFKDSLTLSSATRAGARTGSAEPKVSTIFTDTVAATSRAATAGSFKPGVDVMWIYEANTSGDPISTCPGSKCNVYTYAGGTTWNPSGGSWAYNAMNACLGDPNMSSIGVRLTQHHKAITGFFPMLNNMILKEHTVMRFEPDQTCSP